MVIAIPFPLGTSDCHGANVRTTERSLGQNQSPRLRSKGRGAGGRICLFHDARDYLISSRRR